jgi:hypothetical protein
MMIDKFETREEDGKFMRLRRSRTRWPLMFLKIRIETK